MTLRFARLLIFLPLAALFACTATGPGANDGSYVVQVPLETQAKDSSAARWRTLMRAQDACHNQGFSDAYLVKPKVCASGSGGCPPPAVASYECVGMGYQPL